MEEKTQEEISYWENCIKQMEADKEVFGLVREDREQILKWKLRISELKEKDL